MSFDTHPDHDSDSTHDHNHNDEMIDEVTNMDMTIVEDCDQPINYNGMDEELSSDFNFAATMTLKKNLNDAFDKHAEKVKKTGVKAKIQAFEQVNKDQKYGHNPVKSKVRFEAPSNARPPPVPVPARASGKSDGESLLSVYLRVRPATASTEALDQEDALHNTVEILSFAGDDEITKIRTYPPVESNTSKAIRGGAMFSNTTVKGVKEFDFNQVFGPQSSQEDLYNSTAVPLVEGLFPKDDMTLVGDKIVGQSALLFSYGITNAGKTFTIMGKDEKEHDECQQEMGKLHKSHGIIPRAIDHMLSKIKDLNKSESSGVKYSLNMSYLEIYNEDIYDLLPKKKKSVDSSKNTRGPGAFLDADTKLQLRDPRNGKIHVKGLAKHRVTTLAQGLELAQAAKKKRHTSSNNINADSSRSHSICQFELHASPSGIYDNENDNASVATEASGYSTDDDSVMSNSVKPKSVRFWVVDLAGSERSKRTGTFSRSTRQKEASLINSSLMNLMTCLRALKNNQSSNNSRSQVPFRDSKLTHLFMGHLTGLSASRTSMIVNVNPAVADFDETQHVLSYATDARSVRIEQCEFNVKMQAIQTANGGSLHTHGEDGRPVKNSNKSPPRKLAKLAKKLSPRAVLARRREHQAQAKKADLPGGRGIVASSKERIEKPKLRLAGSKRKLEDEMKGVREELDTERLNAARYQKEATKLQNQLASCEAEIRQELAEETAAQIQYTRERHEEIVKRLKQQLQNNSQTPSKSAKKARMDKADQLMDELMDKIEEGEEEMERMQAEHQQQIQELAHKHATELAEKEDDIAALQSNHAEEMERCEKEISALRSELEESGSDDDTSLTEGSEDGSDVDVSFDEDEKENCGNASMVNRGTPSSNPRLKRLPRGRCSEVACANISPPKSQSASSTKKQRGMGLGSKKSPFKVLSASNAAKKKLSRSGSSVEGTIYPNSQPDCDEETGLFIRPRGRAPHGRKWDAEKGGWKLSILA